MKPLNLDTIRIDGGTQPRCEIDESLVKEYAEHFESDIELPPVVVFADGAEHWLADGFHRYHAARRVGLTSLPADVQKGTLRDAILYSVGANAAHGKRRQNKDKRKAVLTLLEDKEWAKWSNVEISNRCGVSDEFVRQMRSSLPTVGSDDPERTFRTKHGTEATMDTTKIGKGRPRSDSRKAAAEALEQLGPETSNEEIAALAGCSPSTVAEARKDIGAGHSKRSEEVRSAAYSRVSAYIGGTLDGAAEGMLSVMSRNGRAPSQLSYALEIANPEEVRRWIDILAGVIGNARKLQRTLKEAAK